jgi:parallel beta-helix repeat protein
VSSLNFQHNGTTVASEPTLDFVDSSDIVWTPTDDPANTRLKLSAANGTVFNVKNYGAVGDGTTNDTTAILAADSACAAAGGVLFFPAATYVCWNAALTSKCIAGAGATVTKLILPSGTSSNKAVVTIGTTDVVIEGLWFDPNGVSAAKGIQLGSGAVRVRIQDCYFSNFSAGGGVYVQGNVTDSAILHCTFSGNGTGILADPAAVIVGLAINSNTFTPATTGHAININTANAGASAVDLTVVGNTIRGYNNASGSPIQFAVCFAGNISNSLIADNTIDTITTDGIHLEGAYRITVSGNTITNCQRGGIVLVNGSNSTVSDVTISGNQVSGCNTVMAGTGGISAEGSTAISRVTIVGNTVRACEINGIHLGIGGSFTVVGNIVSNTIGGPGINHGNGTDAIFALNRCYDDQGTPTQTYGLQIGGTTETDVIVALNNFSSNLTAPYSDSSVTTKSEFRKVINLPSHTAGFTDSDVLERIECWLSSSDWAAGSKTLGWVPPQSYIVNVRMHCTVNFNNTSPTLSLGYNSTNKTVYATATSLATAGILSPTLGSGVGYEAGTTTRQAVAYFGGSGTPSQGKVLVILEFYRVSTSP